jgi:hypothetical protein
MKKSSRNHRKLWRLFRRSIKAALVNGTIQWHVSSDSDTMSEVITIEHTDPSFWGEFVKRHDSAPEKDAGREWIKSIEDDYRNNLA